MQTVTYKQKLAIYHYDVAAGEIGLPHRDEGVVRLRALVKSVRSPIRLDRPNLVGKFNTVM